MRPRGNRPPPLLKVMQQSPDALRERRLHRGVVRRRGLRNMLSRKSSLRLCGLRLRLLRLRLLRLGLGYCLIQRGYC